MLFLCICENFSPLMKEEERASSHVTWESEAWLEEPSRNYYVPVSHTTTFVLITFNYIKCSQIQCWGSVTFWCGSGSGSSDPYLWLMDPDPTGTSSSVKNLIFLLKSLCLNVILQSAQHIYEKKEGYGAGSVPLTNGSGSGRPKNMRILRIRIRFWIRILNTAQIEQFHSGLPSG